jgi:hypothetical protein
MRNVFKGFQVSHKAVPKIHQTNINKSFSTMHAPGLKRPAIRGESGVKLPKKAHKLPGRNPGTKIF